MVKYMKNSQKDKFMKNNQGEMKEELKKEMKNSRNEIKEDLIKEMKNIPEEMKNNKKIEEIIKTNLIQFDETVEEKINLLRNEMQDKVQIV